MKKIITFTILFLTAVLLFAKEHTIVSFNIHGNNGAPVFQDAFNYLINKKNHADIVLLQEVKIINKNSIEKSLTNGVEGIWDIYTTYGYLGRNGDNNQHNVVLVRRNVFKQVKYLNLTKYNTKEKQNDMCESTFNNVQALEIHTKDRNKFIVVNAHVSPHGVYRIVCNKDCEQDKHIDDYLNLKNFVEKIGREKPVILGGDMNYIMQDLQCDICGNKFGNDWYIDGTSKSEFLEKEKIEPWLSTIGDDREGHQRIHDFDHFIFNFNEHFERFNVRIKKTFLEQYGGSYTMRYGFDNAEGSGVIYKDGGDYEYYSTYKSNVSDHLPICITIETK